jgi:hypothetical protein
LLDPDDGGTATVYAARQRRLPEDLNVQDFVTKAMEQKTSWEANSSSASQEIPRLLPLLCSQTPAACPCSETDESIPRHSLQLKIYSNRIFPAYA